MPYTTAKYVEEKEKNLRRPNGIKYLKRLKVWHRTAIAMHVAGVKGTDIANLVGKGPAVVSLVLSDPLAEKIIDRYKELARKDLDALYFKSIEVLHDVLNTGDHANKLKASKQVFDQFEKEIAKSGEGNTAEDVIQAILEQADSVTFQMKGKENTPKEINPEDS